MQNMTKEDSAIANDVTPENSRCENESQNPDGSAGPIPDGMSAQRVFKKVSPNQKLTLYLSSRDLVVSPEGIDRITGVLLVDPEFVEERKVYGQVTLTFRYGREDEEVMGLKFCNEAIMCLCLLYPPNPTMRENTTPLQEALIKRLGVNAHPFSMEITPLAPPSVQLVPAKEYNGAPIGTSYDIRAYVDRVDEKLHRRSTIRMGIRVVQRAFAPPSPHMYVPGGEGRTCKERAKQNRKALLFGGGSAPMEARCPKSEKESTNLHILGQLENQGARPSEKSGKSAVMGDTFGDKLAYSRAVLEMDVDKGLDDSGTEGRELQGNEETSDQTFGPEKENDGGSVENKAVTEKTISDFYHNSCGGKRPSLAAYLAGVPAPKACTEKYYLLSEGKICLTATLDKAIYSHGEDVRVSISIENNSSKTVKRLKVFIVQHVDVCMFSNGKFKNVVATLDPKENCSIHSGRTFEKTFSLIPMKSTTKNWIALEESYNKAGTSLASTVTSTMNNPDDRNVFAIYVSYYVKVKLLVNRMGGDLSLKLPFTLMHTCCDLDHTESLSRVKPTPTTDEVQHDAKPPGVSPSRDIDKDFPTPTTSSALTQCPEEVKPEKDGT